MDERIDDARRDLEATRARISETVNELTDRITEPIHALRERLDVIRAARAHPWIALGVALGAGVLLGATGADAKAARASARAARRAGGAAKGGAVALVAKVRHRDQTPDGDATPASPGLLTRLGDHLADALEGPLEEMMGDFRRSTGLTPEPRGPSGI